MPRTLVTGAGGYIGGRLVQKLLERGQSVVGLAHHEKAKQRLHTLGCDSVEGNILNLESLKRALHGIDKVYHCAGRICALSKNELIKVNRDGTGNVAKACAAMTSPPKLLVVSSLAAAGPSKRDEPRKESEPCKPVSIYGQSKLDGEKAAGCIRF